MLCGVKSFQSSLCGSCNSNQANVVVKTDTVAADKLAKSTLGNVSRQMQLEKSVTCVHKAKAVHGAFISFGHHKFDLVVDLCHLDCLRSGNQTLRGSIIS